MGPEMHSELGVQVIRRDTFEPLYHQVQEMLREQIRNGLAQGSLSVGDYFTSESEVCEAFGISRITAKRAMNELAREGYVERKRGKGTFIAKPRIEHSVSRFYSFTSVMRDLGLKPKSALVSISKVSKPPADVASTLGIESGAVLVCIRRLRMVGDDPIMLETSYASLEVFPGLDELDFNVVSLYEAFAEKYGVTPVTAEEYYQPTVLYAEEAELLQAQKGLPAFLIERVTYDADGRPIEYGKAVARGDRLRLKAELR